MRITCDRHRLVLALAAVLVGFGAPGAPLAVEEQQ